MSYQIEKIHPRMKKLVRSWITPMIMVEVLLFRTPRKDIDQEKASISNTSKF